MKNEEYIIDNQKSKMDASATPDAILSILMEAVQSLKESSVDIERRLKKLEEQLINQYERLPQEQTSSMDGLPYSFTNSRRINQSLKELDEDMMSDLENEIIENHFYNSFENGRRNFFGVEFDRIIYKGKGLANNDIFDIVLISDSNKTIGIVFEKSEARLTDIPEVQKKPESFKANYPMYQGYKFYLGIASRKGFSPELECACIEHGIAILKRVGYIVEINDEHVKEY